MRLLNKYRNTLKISVGMMSDRMLVLWGIVVSFLIILLTSMGIVTYSEFNLPRWSILLWAVFIAFLGGKLMQIVVRNE